MKSLWLLRGNLDAPGWKDLEKDAKADEVDLLIFDRAAWALIAAEEAPTKYEGLVPVEPRTGLYVSEQGQPIYVVDGKEVRGPLDVIKALGTEAEQLLEKIGDPDTVLDRLGKAF